MSKFREFSIATASDSRGGPTTARAKRINSGLAAFRNAIDWKVRHERPDGPFAKLAIEMVQVDWDSPRGHKFGGIAICHVPTNLDAAGEMSSSSLRELGGALTLDAMSWTESTFGWTNEWFLNLIDRSRRHRGSFRYALPKLRVVDRQSGRSYVSFVEFADEYTLVETHRLERDSTTSGIVEVHRSTTPHGLDYYSPFDPRNARLRDGRIEYLDRHKQQITSIPLEAFDPAPPRDKLLSRQAPNDEV